jgi:hypothetical protein
MADTLKTSVEKSLAAQMRPLVLTVTCNHTLAFVGGDIHSTVTVPGPLPGLSDVAIQYQSVGMANAIRREAEDATAALLAKVFA